MSLWGGLGFPAWTSAPLVGLKSSFDDEGCCTQLTSDHLVAEGTSLCTEDSIGECSVKQPHIHPVCESITLFNVGSISL